MLAASNFSINSDWASIRRMARRQFDASLIVGIAALMIIGMIAVTPIPRGMDR
jgi:hypothetical protein